MADQLSASFLPAYGHSVVKTPHLDEMAAHGTVFESAYTNSPLCAPARFSTLTGRYNSRIGAFDNASELASSVPTFAHHLRASGYQTCLAGKMHFVGADQLHGYEERLTTDIYPADFGWTPDWERADERIDWWFHNMDSVRHAGVADSSNQLDYDDEVGYQAVRKLRDLARSSDGRPWMMTASFTHPHDPYVARPAYWDRYRHDDIDLPKVGAIPFDKLDEHSKRLRHVSAMDDVEITNVEVRNARHAYYANISYIDDWVGTLLATLRTTGMADNTVVIFTADHGDMLGERGLWYKMNFFETACRVPLIITGPDIVTSRAPEHVSLLDLLPTMLHLADVDAPAEADGTSLMPLLGGYRDRSRTVIGEYMGEGAIAPIVMIRKDSLKYIHCDADPPQLYDLDTDLREMTNVADRAEYADHVDSFAKMVHAHVDTAALHAEVLASQRSRRTVDKALRQGRYTPWDFQPFTDASQRFMRNHLDLNEVESSRRFPRV